MKALWLFPVLVVLACGQNDGPEYGPGTPVPTPTQFLVLATIASLPPTPTPIPLPIELQCPTAPKDAFGLQSPQAGDTIEIPERLKRAVKIAIKEFLDDPKTFEWFYPETVYLYDGGRPVSGDIVGQRGKDYYKDRNLMVAPFYVRPPQMLDMRGDFFVTIAEPVEGWTALTYETGVRRYYSGLIVWFWTLYDSTWSPVVQTVHKAYIELREHLIGERGCFIHSVWASPLWEPNQ